MVCNFRLPPDQHEGAYLGRRVRHQVEAVDPLEAEAAGRVRQQADAAAPDRGPRRGWSDPGEQWLQLFSTTVPIGPFTYKKNSPFVVFLNV